MKELEETVADRDEKKVELEESNNCLVKTKIRLDVTTQQRDEQGHLVGKHLKTEEKLTEEANQVGEITLSIKTVSFSILYIWVVSSTLGQSSGIKHLGSVVQSGCS